METIERSSTYRSISYPLLFKAPLCSALGSEATEQSTDAAFPNPGQPLREKQNDKNDNDTECHNMWCTDIEDEYLLKEDIRSLSTRDRQFKELINQNQSLRRILALLIHLPVKSENSYPLVLERHRDRRIRQICL